MSGKKSRTFKDWWGENKADYNAQRRERYRTDPAYRKRAQETVRASRERHGKKIVQPDGSVFRHLIKKKKTRVKVWRIGFVADALDVTVRTIRYWQAMELIPLPIVEGPQRYYTAPQIDAMVRLKDQLPGLDQEGRGKIIVWIKGEWHKEG